MELPSGLRLERLRRRVMSYEPSICHERAVTYTKRYKEAGLSLSPVRLRARALVDMLDTMTVSIEDDELIVGLQASRPRAAPLFPEYSWEWIADELTSFDKRDADRFTVSEKTLEILQNVLGSWRGQSVRDRAHASLPPEVTRAQNTLAFILTSMGSGIGHLAPNYAKVLERGLIDIKQEAERRLSALEPTDPKTVQQADFYRAAITVCDATCRFAERYANMARKLAVSESNPMRASELNEIARICEKVPARPAGSFREAIQSFWFVHLIIQVESNGHSISPGRFDQYMYKFYKADIEKDILTEGQALELLECLWIKMNEIMKVRDKVSSKAFGGYPVFQNLIVGGQTPAGRDATNALSYLCIEATRRVRLPQPSLSVRVHNESPREFLESAGELTKEGMGLPAFFNDEVIIPVLLGMGVRLEEARDYAEVGCVEPQAPGRTNGYYPAGFLNLGKVLNLALNEGKDPISGETVGLSDANSKGLSSADDVLAAVKNQIDYFVKLMVTGNNILDVVHGQMAPNPFVSLLVDDCMAKGKSYEEGGAVYNYTSPNVVGLANVADSLMAIRQLVFEEKLVEMDELIEAILEDFEGKEPLRRLLINRAPKYGNDNPEVDSIAREISSFVLKRFKRYRNSRGGTFEPGLQSISAHALFQGAVSATPDGRTRETMLADGGISPAQGRDRNGPTAIIRSASQLDHLEASNGALLNVKLSPESVAGEEGTDNLVALIRSYFKMGGQHIQFNIISSETLRNAQIHPEDYPNLIVRVAGFSVPFTAIDKTLQDDIIQRTEHTL